MNIPKKCDVVVIGGGPGGSFAASYLSQKGYDVVLFEKQRHPRYQVGESCLPEVWEYCDMIGVTPEVEAEGFLTKGGGMVTWKEETRTMNFSDFGYSRPALHLERDRFDEILINKAKQSGAKIFEEFSVTQIKNLDNTNASPIVQYRRAGEKEPGKISTTFVIDASGQNAIIGRQLGLRKIDSGFKFMSIWGYFNNFRYLDSNGFAHDQVELPKIPPVTYVTSIPQVEHRGWSWYIPLRKRLSVGITLPTDILKQGKSSNVNWEKYFLEQCETIPVISELLKNSNFIDDSIKITRNYSYKSSKVAGGGFFLIGDAAGFVDPIFSVGLLVALYSAFAASWAIDMSMKKIENTSHYQALYSKQLNGRMELARALALPQYKSSDDLSALAREALKLERNNVKNLMMTVAMMTSRSEEFKQHLKASQGKRSERPMWKILNEFHL